MGISYVQGTVRGPTGVEATVRFLIDNGATYSLLPAPVWQTIGLQPKREMAFVLADGTSVRRAVAECHLSLPQGEPVPPSAAPHARVDGVEPDAFPHSRGRV